MANKTFSIIKVIRAGWHMYKKYWKLSLIIFGAVVLIQMVEFIFMPDGIEDMLSAYSTRIAREPFLIMDIIQFDHPNMQAGAIVSLLIKYFIFAGIYCMMLLIMDGQKKSLTFEGFAMGHKTYWKFVTTSVIVFLITIIGTFLCIIPGVWFGLRLQYATYIVLDEDDVSIFRAIKKSWQITRGNFLRLLAFGILSFFIYLLGIACCFIGIFVTIPWVLLADMTIYMILTRESWSENLRIPCSTDNTDN